MCSVICQIDETHDAKRIFVLDELHLRNSDTPSACEEFVNRTEQWTGRGPLQVFVYGDATGEARQRAGAGAPSDWAAVKQFFRSRPEYQMTFRYKPTNPQQRDRVAAVNAMLCNSAGERRTEVDPKCKYLIDDLEQVVWTTGTALLDQRTNRMLTHMSDAYGYLVETECGIRTKGGPRTLRRVGAYDLRQPPLRVLGLRADPRNSHRRTIAGVDAVYSGPARTTTGTVFPPRRWAVDATGEPVLVPGAELCDCAQQSPKSTEFTASPPSL
jgi:hypothetical protein